MNGNCFFLTSERNARCVVERLNSKISFGGDKERNRKKSIRSITFHIRIVCGCNKSEGVACKWHHHSQLLLRLPLMWCCCCFVLFPMRYASAKEGVNNSIRITNNKHTCYLKKWGKGEMISTQTFFYKCP